MNRKDKLVYGWGINDADYCVQKFKIVEGKNVGIWSCPAYVDWKDMLRRSLSKEVPEKFPSYIGVTIDKNWQSFAQFLDWVLNVQPNKYWKNSTLDKDLLETGNRVYGPDTCCYISKGLNTFLTNSSSVRGQHMLGVSLRKGRFKARCSNPFLPKDDGSRYIGCFKTELEAHKAWQAKKHEYACMWADIQDDPRVAKRLREIYAPETDWTNK